jgi:hypothetical protein
MIRAADIPDEAWKATGLPKGIAIRAIAAALSSWPGMECRPTFVQSRLMLFLPLPQKEGDA